MSFGLRLSLVVIAGIAVGVACRVESRTGVSIAIAAAGVALAGGTHRPHISIVCVWVMVGALSMAYGSQMRANALIFPPAWIFDLQAPVMVEGRLKRDASQGDSGVRLEITDVVVSEPTGHHAVLRNIDVLAIVGGELAASLQHEWTAGRWVRMPASLRVPPVVRNPGSPSVRWQHLTRPFDAIASVKSGSLVDTQPGALWSEIGAAVRNYVRRVTHRLDSQSAAVMRAILIGDRAGLDDDITRRLQTAGTFHVMAISGGNVAILTTLCLVTLRTITRRERLTLLCTLAVVLTYGVVVGKDPSVVRAVLAATLYLSLRLIGMAPRALNIVAVTGLVTALANPLVVLDVGAWLSFGATLGLITVLPRLLGSRVQGPGSRRRVAVSRVLWIARGLLLATIAAEIMILPVTASVFMRVGIAGLLLNFVAIPAMTVVQVAGLLLCALAPLWTDGAALAAVLARGATVALTDSAALVELMPWLSLRVPPPPVVAVAVYYTAVVLALAWSGRRLVPRIAILVAGVCAAAIVTAPWTLSYRPPAGWLRMTMVDVGQGEALLLQLPGGQSLLMDAGGSSSGFDVGGRVVTPALWASGVRRLDWLAVTHGDVDHIGGAIRVAEDLRPREMWEGVPVPQHPLLTELRNANRAIPWRRLFAGHQIETDGALIDVVHPPLPDWERRRVRNDDSLVLRVRFGRVELLLTGDTGAEFEASYVRESSSPPIRVLKVGHHGSRTSTSEPFLDAFAPTVALVSAGQGNLFGHPAPVVITRLQQRGVDIFRTDRDGATVIETDGRELRVRSATGRVLTVMARS